MEKFDNIIDILSSDDYYKAKKLINNLDNRDLFIKKIISISNPYVFDRFCKMFEYDMDTSSYYQERNKMIKNMLLNNKESLPNNWVTEYIISYFLEDNYYNFMVNFYQMVNYLSHIKMDLVSIKNIKLYQELCDIKKESLTSKIEFFKKHMHDNIKEMFYDDIRKVKNDCYKELVNKSIKLDINSPIYCEDVSNNQSIDIYYLNGEEFYAFVKVFNIERNDLTDHSDYIFLDDNRLGNSFSYISDKNIGTVDYEQKKVVLLYDNINYSNIMYVHSSDLHSKRMSIQDDYLSEKINELPTPDSLIGYTKNYNEIYIIGKIKPKALVCYDNITRDDLAFAKKYDLSILLINKDKYRRYETFDDDYKKDTYII